MVVVLAAQQGSLVTSSRRRTGSAPARRPGSCSGRPSWSTLRPPVAPRRPPAIASSRRTNGTVTWTTSEEAGPTQTGTQSFALTDEQVDTFARDGFVIVENLIDPALARRALDRYEDLFAGRFETGLYPDEWNWRSGVHRDDLTRQICNAWKSDRGIADVVLRPDIGRACALLGGWPGARLSQDNVLWKPPGWQGPRLSPGLELRTVGRALGVGQLLDRPRGHHVSAGHG